MIMAAEPVEPTEPTEPVKPVEPTEPRDDYKELKGALDKERQARKAAEKEVATARKATEKAEQDALEKNKEYETLWRQSDEKLQGLQQKVQERDIDAAIGAISVGITKDGNKRNDISALYRRYAKFTDDGVVFEEGGMPLTAEQLTEKIKADRPYLVDGNQASGGGATGSGSGGTAAKTMPQEQFDALHPNKKMKFFLDGGQIQS